VIAEGLSFWAVVPLVLATFAFLACAASFGLWLSVRAPTVQRASGAWLLAVGLWVGGTFLAAEAAYMDQRPPGRFAARYPPVEPPPLVWDRAINPVLAWSQLVFRYRDDAAPRYGHESWDGQVESVADAWPSFVGIGTYLLLAWGLYMAAGRRFEREGRG
jgi:hypothetical protein